MSGNKIYLDYAAATPVNDQVLKTMEPYFSDRFYNPSSKYSEGIEIYKQIESTRFKIASILLVKSDEIYFTAGGTEANNLAISGVMEQNPGKNIIISAIEHESISDTAKKFKYKIAPVDSSGRIIVTKLKELIDKDTVLISVMYANNEIGTIQPLSDIKKLILQVRKDRIRSKNKLPLYFHSDACQAANYLSLNASGLGLDLMTLNGGKIYGPKQSGCLFIHRNVKLSPQILGGGQEKGVRSGTENVPAIIGFGNALELVNRLKNDESKRLVTLRDYLAESLLSTVNGCSINGSKKNRLPNNLNVSFKDQDNEAMLFKLDQNGVMCSTGSACSAQKDTISPTLLAIGLSENQALSSLRFSLGRKTTKQQIEKTVEIIQKILS